MSNDVAAIEAVVQEEARAMAAGDAAAMCAVFTEDCVVMPPNEPPLHGHDGVHTWLTNVVAAFDIEGEYSESDVTVAGDTAVQCYRASLKLLPKDGSEAITLPLKGVHVFRRGGDGAWRIAQDIWNTDA